ncbi:MAG: HNH endonuclease signature motif containing protein, partial [Bacteroidota bacterium]
MDEIEAKKERARQKARQWRLDNPERVKELRRIKCAKRKENWEEFLRRERERYAKRKDIVLARQAAYREANREKVRAAVRKHYQKNPTVYVAGWAKRNAAKLRATPIWADQGQIKAIYKSAKDLSVATGIPHEVDHIEPLRGRNVCGLHVVENLRVVTRSENRKKGFKQIANNNHVQ